MPLSVAEAGYNPVMARLIVAAAVAVALLGQGLPAQQPASSSEETARINAWFEKKYEEQLAFSPIQQTFLGRKSAAIDDMSIAAQDQQLAWQRASVAEMKQAFDYAKLTPEAQTSYDLWIYQLQQAEAALPFRTNAYVFDQMSAIHAFFPQLLIAFHRVDDAADLEAYVARIRESGRALRQLIEISKRNVVAGVRPPRFSFDFVIDESTKIITGAPFDKSGTDSAVWADVKAKVADLQKKGTLDEAKAKRAPRRGARGADRTVPRRVSGPHRVAEGGPPQCAREDVRRRRAAQRRGVLSRAARQPDDDDLSADEIHQIGLTEVARLRGEMEAIRKEVGFAGDLQAFFAELRDKKDDPRYYYPDTDEGRAAYIKDATAAIDRIKAVLPKYFGILPKADLVVKRVEPFREQPGAAQHYFPSTPDGSRPGVYYAHLADMKAMPKSELEVIAYHEGLPGHHMQIAIAQELTTIPTFRRQAIFTPYSEGWGLYSEWLAREMPGTYQDPYSRFGRLGSEIWRAIRLVVDTGLHAKGWSEEAGGAVLPRQLGDDRAAGALRGAALHGDAGPGHQLQDRDAEDSGVAPEGRSRAR